MADASDVDPASVPPPKPREHCGAASCPQQAEKAIFDKGSSDRANAESEDHEDEEEDVFFDDDNDINHGDKEDDDDEYASEPVPPAAPSHPPQPFPQSSDREGDPSPDRPLRVFADGIYDLFHFGHARSLEQAKKSFPNTYLLVGCCSDATTHKYKGKTVMTEAERYESLRHCKWVDEVIPDSPWVINQEFLDKHQIDFVAHDSLPYADTSGAGKDVYEYVKAVGKFKETQRTEGVSTSDLIMRILKDYNDYIMRNLAKGYSREDLGVSFVKEKQLRVNKGISTILQKVKEQQDKLNTEWVENADSWVTGFLEKFEEKCHVMVGV